MMATPGITAPVPSVTRPVTLADGVCEKSTEEKNRKAKARMANLPLSMISALSLAHSILSGRE
jgi:hypothetical protein